METNQLIKEIKSVEYFDKRRYRFTFLNNTVRYIASVTTKLEEYREQGLEIYREKVGSEEADRAMQEGGEWGSIVHHACFLLATGGAVLYEPPGFQTIGIQNEDVGALVKQNVLIRRQLDVANIPHMTINDQFRFLQCRKFKTWIDIVKPEVMYAEAVVYSLTHDIAGRIDFLFKVEGGSYPVAGVKDVFIPKGIILPDVKSGQWSRKHFLQMAAYRMAVQESLGLDVVATVGIHLKAQTKSGLNTLVHQGDEIDNDFKVYQNVAAIYDDKHQNDTPQEFEFESVLLGTKANDVVLGATLPNPVAEAEVAKEVTDKVNAIESPEPLSTEAPPAVGATELEFLRPTKRGNKK